MLPDRLRESTPARVGLTRAGTSLSTQEWLRLREAHAAARDAVHAPFHPERLQQVLPGSRVVQSRAANRPAYIRFPHLGQRLSEHCAAQISPQPCDVVFVIADGLSPQAAEQHAVPLLQATLPRLEGLRLGPIVIVQGGRVAIADEIGERLQARLSVILIGERPGLSCADSLGVYLTYDPRRGRTDAERNCLSNIHTHGTSHEEAAERLVWLIRAALQRSLSGVGLKEGDASLLARNVIEER